jgi:hypothetical protein
MESKTKTAKAKKTSGKKTTSVALPQADLWRSLYALSQHWQSDIGFYKENIEQTRTMVADVTNLEKDRMKLKEGIDRHLKHITSLVENPFSQNAQVHKDEHVKLESDVALFSKKFRSVKTEVFKLTEHVIHSEKVKKMIDWA